MSGMRRDPLMFRRIAALLICSLAGNVQAQDVSADIQVQLFSNFVAFELNNDTFDMNVNIAGPADYFFSQTYPGTKTGYHDLANADSMADGLYKYEVKPVPVRQISQRVSSAMPDRNTLYGRSAPKVSPVSGTFRVLNGQIFDAQLPEGGVE
jgi:hypothetical protein